MCKNILTMAGNVYFFLIGVKEGKYQKLTMEIIIFLKNRLAF